MGGGYFEKQKNGGVYLGKGKREGVYLREGKNGGSILSERKKWGEYTLAVNLGIDLSAECWLDLVIEYAKKI